MILHDLSYDHPLLADRDFRLITRDGQCTMQREAVLCEHTLTLYIDQKPSFEIVCVPQYLIELVLGRLCTEGLISSINDIKELTIHADGTRADVTLETVSKTASVHPASAGWQPDWIFALADHFAKGSPLHETTWATHSCILAMQDRVLFECEDIGRHNALDKVVGYALRSGIPLSECIVYSSGRVPLDMAMKAIHAGIGVYVSKAAPTQKAIEAAQKNNLTLICAARRDRMKLFT